MPKILKIAGYFLLFIVSFFFFLYFSFPYDILKDRIVSSASQQLGPDYDVRIGEFSPSFFTGAVLKNVKIIKHEGDRSYTLWSAQKVKIRASIGSILFGKTNVSFSIKNQKSSVSGSFKTTEDGFNFSGSFSDFDVGNFGIFTGENSAKLVSAIDGDVKLNVNKKQPVQSTGSAELKLSDIMFKAGEIKIGEFISSNIPDILLSKGSGSIIKMEMSKGAIKIKEFKLSDGDLKLDLTGDLFISSAIKNYRMNLKGTFSVSQKFEQAVPIFFMVEKQRQPDGSYPISITGRLGQPIVKVGDFTLPLNAS